MGIQSISREHKVIAESKSINSKAWTKDRIVGLSICLLALASSIYFPGAGFLVFLPLQSRLGKYRKFTLYTLVLLEVVHLVTALGTIYGPLISHVGPSVKES
jgi:hypothetical protein